ncbi:F-actin-monooxygenase Mical isoform X8 [Glossina fuscipes]|uniref:F-actin monooxygenase n=1 Tax=Glossina fuscipes TaxID=7396 RepID=A0A9C5ZC60_9MUSC|nr:F-actin-monooxygenase Mical isoform X8 [Glossina fuscipes]
MSRSAYQRQQQKLQLQQQLLAQQQMAENEAAAAAAELFDLFCVATTMRQILGLHRNMCELIGLRPSPLNDFYPKVKAKVRSWKAQALWKKFDARASQRVYAKGNACTGTRVLVIGAGPCGLRTAIEAQLLGAKVVVVEKRDRISRNNVLHLWPFVITDLRNLGAKKFYGKFCAGSIDHISIRQLQCILLKVALLLGVEIHEGVSFERTIEPTGDGCGWRAALSPIDHAVSHYEFDILIGADGKRNTLESFKRKEFRGKLAIAITANFINKKTEAEAKVEEISGVAFIFNQSFFKELYHTTGIDLENIVYYKDETHYFVMTAKKHSLIDKGVILQDFADPAELLAPANVNTEKLLDYAREAAEFSTKYQMPNLEFAVNHYGKPDVAMFDFTSMFAAESSCRVIVRKGFRLLQCLVGDSLLEPFWPTGSGCARGFLSSMDSAYAIKLWSNSFNSILGVVAQRESIYRLLNQTTPENLQRDIGSYTVDPATRYPNLNRTSVNVWQIKHLVDTDDQQILEQTYMDTNTLQITQVDTPVKRKRRSGDSVPLSSILLRWVCAQLHSYEFAKELKEASDIFTNGKVLCALINRYRPDLVDMNAVKDLSPVESNDLAFRILEKEMHIQRIMNGRDSLQLQSIESKIWLNYLEQICEVFRGEIPHIKHPKIDFTELREKYRLNNAHAQPDFSKLLQLSTKPPKSRSPLHDMVDVPHIVQRRSVLDEEKLKRQRKHEQLMANNNAGNATGTGQAPTDTPRRAKKRRNNTDKAANITAKVALAFKKQSASEKCHFCKQTVYLMEKLHTEGLIMHRACLKCHHCHSNLRLGAYAFDRDDPSGRFYCTQHFRLPAKAIRPVVRKQGQKKNAQQQAAAKPQEDSPITSLDSIKAIVSASGDSEIKRGLVDSVTQMELLDRGQTPERIEFANTDNMSDGEPSEEHIIDEHEWSGRNFLPESNNDSGSDLTSSDETDTESDSEMYEEANDSPLGAQTLQLASDWIGKQNYTETDDSDDFYDSSEGIADDGKDDTEGEEFQKARELRREEVRLQPLPPNLPTDTETEPKILNKEIVIEENQNNADIKNVEESETKLSLPESAIKRKGSEKSGSSEQSFKSTTSSLVNGYDTIKPMAVKVTKADMEKLEQNSERKFSSDIEAISEKLYRLNNVMKLNKDLETLAKENLIRSDILKKLTLKEKWLTDNVPVINNSTKFEEKIDKLLASKSRGAITDSKLSKIPPAIQKNVKDQFNSTEKLESREQAKVDHLKDDKENVLQNHTLVTRSNSLKKATNNQDIANHLEQNVVHVDRDNGKPTQQIQNNNKMEIENILNIVKTISISNGDDASVKSTTASSLSAEVKETDAGKILYNATKKDKNISANKLKEIDVKNFSDTMDTIKSQMVVPTISSQAPSSVDLSKYFPHQKQEKSTSVNVNKNQKTLKDVDLTKYFPTSPAPQRRSSVVTVADKLKKSQTEKTLTCEVAPEQKPKTSLSNGNVQKTHKQPAAKKKSFSLKEHQLDGSTDVAKKKSPVKVVTTTAVATVAKKGNVRIIKKIVPRGTKAKKLSNQKIIKKSLIPRDEADKILDELLKDELGGQQRSPSMEYQNLFKEDKSPSEDISDKIECILEAEGIDLGIPRKTKSQIDESKKLLKAKSFGNEELQANISTLSNDQAKEGGDRPSGVQNILKRFESMSSMDKSNDQKAAFKLRRMESTTSNLNKSSESLMSSDSLQQSDLEKTMEYLKTEWRSEATTFLQKKRSSYFAEKQGSQEKEEKESFASSSMNDLPIQNRESKLAKFFGVKSKSPEKRKSPLKRAKKEKTKEERKPIIYSSLEELALISMSKQLAKAQQDQKRLVVADETDSNVSQNAKESKETEVTISEARRDSNVSLGSVASLASEKSETENKRHLIEDIRNLPKTGCDKSLSNSRRSSQASIQSRTSLGENTIKMKDATPSASNGDRDEEDVSNSSSTKKPNILQPNETTQQQASSDEDSIEKLFSQFSDEMLVNVEFDSNDELIAITPRAALRTEQEKQNVKTFADDKANENIYQSHFKTLNLEDASLAQNNFPIRPQRRQKSTSSSSDASVSMPQRIKNKLTNLSPSNMPPSVQDLLQKMCSTEELFTQQSKALLKFPRLTDDEESLEEPLSPEPKNKLLNELTELNAMNLPDIVVEASSSPPVTENKFEGESTSQRSSTNSESTVVHIAKHSTQPKTENVYEFSKILVPKKESSPEWDMEKVISSPMPKRKSKIKRNEPSEVQEIQVCIDDALCKSNIKESEKSIKLLNGKVSGEKSKACLDLVSAQALPEESKKQVEPLVKEGTPEWNMLLLPTSPMPRRKSHELSQNFVLKELSPTNSIKMLNNMDASTEAAQKRLIEEFEMERRQALVQRDKQYQVLEKPEIESKNSTFGSGDNSKRTTPLSTPVKQSPRGSRTNSQLSLNTNRGGTPPMLKPLDVYGSSQSSQSSRRSSFAFIEMLDAKPIIAPMPKKLDLPLLDMHEIPDNLAGPIPENMKNRPWPNPHAEDDDLTNDENGTDINALEETNVIQYDNALANAGPKRLWPDGKTMFKNERTTQHLGSRKEKPRSETPDVCDVQDESLDESKTVAKSISDLSIATRGTGVALQSRSSADSDFSSRATLTESQKYGTQRSTRHQKLNNATLDASTQLLLARSKRLHNRKCDFVNERVVERNPYMRDVLNDNKKSFDTISDSDDDDNVSTYRPKRYTSTSNMTRFPTSRTLGTKHSAQKYGYVPTSITYNNSSFNGRSLPPLQTSLITTNSSSNYHYPSSTLMGRPSYRATTAATKNYSRQSPSRYRELKDSCVLS